MRFITRTLTEAEVKQYYQHGYFVYGPLLSGDSLQALQNEVDRLWALASRSYDQESSWNANALLNGVHKDSAVIRDVLYRCPLVDVMTQVIGPNIKAASNQLTFKHPGDQNPYHWHQDNGYGPLIPESTVSCWLALDDVDERNGCLWIVPGSHQRGRVRHSESRGRERIASVKDEDLATPALLKAGECLFFHGDTLHMSKGNSTDKMRRAYFFRYADADAIEAKTGRPRIGKLLRGHSKFPEVTECSELVCQPDATQVLPATKDAARTTR